MSLKDWIISRLGGTPPDPAVEMRTTTIPTNSVQGKALMAALASGDQRQIMRALQLARAHEPTPEQAAALTVLGGDHPADHIPWDWWMIERKAMLKDAPAGWTVCRFFHRTGMNEGRGVYGLVKGDFGIWRQPFHVCDHDADETDDPKAILPSLTYLPSGFDIGLFADVATAGEAAALSEKLDWSTMPDCEPTDVARNAWRDQMELLRKTWNFHGIAMEERRHAHDPSNGEFIGIFARGADLAAGKPAKVS